MSNKPSFDEAMAFARELGSQAGKGKDVQIKADLYLIEAAYLGALTTTPNKHGADIDDATKFAEEYWKAQQGAVIFDAKANNQRKTISNFRKDIKLGSNPKWGTGEPLGIVNKLMATRQTLRKNPANKLDDAHNTLMRWATEQLKRDQLMDDDELKSFCFKPDTEPKTAEEVLEALRKTAANLRLGKVSNCPDADNSPEVISIVNLCTKRLENIAKARQGGTP